MTVPCLCFHLVYLVVVVLNELVVVVMPVVSSPVKFA